MVTPLRQDLLHSQDRRKELLTRELPPAPSSVGGKANLPAYYFHLVVYREQDKTRLSRRYSQFRWLHHQVQSDPPKYTNSSPIYGEAASPLRFPQPPLIQFQNDNFAQNRMDLLAAYLSDMLSRPGYARHPAVLAFLDIK